MNQPALSAEDLVAWNDKTSQEWRKLITDHPEILRFPCDIADAGVVGELLQHIVVVELRYAELLSGLPVSGYTSIPFDSADSLYAAHDRAVELFRHLLAAKVNWDDKVEFMTRTVGLARATRRAVFLHAHLHGVRHYAQLATLVRQHGIKLGWSQDYFIQHIERV
jgi:uncharacterized damage-inducible protein DinB